MIESGPVEARFKETDQSIVRRSIRSRLTLGRHCSGPQLSYYFFPQRRIVRHMIQIRAVENDAGRRCRSGRAAVMASDTVSIHRRPRGRFNAYLSGLHGARVLRTLPDKRRQT
jgi:hypothetical protein